MKQHLKTEVDLDCLIIKCNEQKVKGSDHTGSMSKDDTCLNLSFNLLSLLQFPHRLLF